MRRIAAFPPHPLRTRFLSKKLKGGLSHPHSNKASCLEQGGDSMDISAKLRPFYVAKMLYEQTDEDHVFKAIWISLLRICLSGCVYW